MNNWKKWVILIVLLLAALLVLSGCRKKENEQTSETISVGEGLEEWPLPNYIDSIKNALKDKLSKLFGKESAEEIEEEALAEDISELEEINLGEQTRAKSQVLEIIEATESEQIVSETDTVDMFTDRGFDAAYITSMYSMDGSYTGDQEIDNSSEAFHPLYNMIYVSPDNYYWMVYCCNGEFSAYPISYVLSGMADREVLVSETEYVMSYDSVTNCFYRLIPDEEGCVIVEVPRIDADTLDALAAGELEVS